MALGQPETPRTASDRAEISGERPGPGDRHPRVAIFKHELGWGFTAWGLLCPACALASGRHPEARAARSGPGGLVQRRACWRILLVLIDRPSPIALLLFWIWLSAVSGAAGEVSEGFDDAFRWGPAPGTPPMRLIASLSGPLIDT